MLFNVCHIGYIFFHKYLFALYQLYNYLIKYNIEYVIISVIENQLNL